MPHQTCPAPSQLHDFVLGKLPEEVEDNLVAHLDACPSCEAAVAALDDASDEVVQALRGPKQPEEFATEAELAAALARVKVLPISPQPTDSAAADDQPDKSTRENLGDLRDYRLLEKIGEGGMGAVYKAMHTKLDKIVALKVLPSNHIRDEQAIGRFHREMKAVGRLEHPNIVGASDAGEAEGQHFLVMQYVNGIDLAALMEEFGPLPVAEACELIRQAATALQFVHEQGMVHRDIKPSNLMVTSDGQVKLLDLGLALLHDQPDVKQQNSDSGSTAEVAGDLTAHGQLMGTLDYMAPEQCDDSHQVDIRADIYSLGATLYKLLSGTAPFGDTSFDTPIKKMIALSEENAPPLRTKRPDVAEPLAAVVRRMLAKKPSQRFAAPADVANALSPFAESSDLPGWLAAEVSDLLPAPAAETLMSVGGLEPMQTAGEKMKDEFDPYYKWLAIPPEEQPPNHYRLLGLKEFEEDEDVIAVSADRQMVHIRTFQSGKYSKQSQRLLNEISAAKICLLNRAKRAAYDERLKLKVAAKQPPPPKAVAPAKLSAKPAVAKRIPEPVQAVEPEPPSVSAFAFSGESPQQPLHRKVHRRRNPIWQALAAGCAVAVLIVVGVVWFLVARDHPNATVAPGTKDTSVADAAGSPSIDDNGAVGGTHAGSAGDPSGVSELPVAIDDSPHGDPAKPSVPSSNVDVGPQPPHAEPIDPSEPVSPPPPATLPYGLAPAAIEPPPVATPPARYPVPDTAARNRVLTQVRERYKDELTDAQTPPQKIEAAQLLRAAALAEREPATRFALLFEVRRLAIEAAAVDLAMDTARQVIDEYDTATWPVLGGTFDEVCKSAQSPDEHLALANEAARLIEEAIADDEIAAAEKICDLAKVSLSKISDVTVKRKIRTLADQVQEMKPHWEQARLARDKLKSEPGNADAHGDVGRYLCLDRDQWQEGLQHLEKSSDAELQPLAARELSSPSTAQAQFELAEAWWSYGSRKPIRERFAVFAHAYPWYQQAAPGLTGTKQQDAEERLVAIDKFLGRKSGLLPSDNSRLTELLNDALLVMTFEPKTIHSRGGNMYVRDLGQLSNTGLLTGAQPARGIAGGALRFDGVDDYIRIDSLRGHLIRGLTAFSISMWLRPESKANTALAFDVGDTFNNSVSMTVEKGAVLQFAIADSMRKVVRAKAPATMSQWQHVVGVWNGKGIGLYVNGELRDQQPLPGYKPNADAIHDIPAQIGAQAKMDYRDERFYRGDIDEMAIVPRSLSPQEIKLLFDAGRNGQPLLAPQQSTQPVASPSATVQSGKWVNVLDQVTDAVIAGAPGTWKKVNGALVLEQPIAGNTTLLDVPTKITGNYDLRASSIVKSGDPHFALRLPIADRSCQLIVNGWKNLGGRTYIHTVDGVSAGDNPNAVGGQLLRLNQLHTHEVAVRTPAPGRATVSYALDGREVFTWSGNISSLTTESAGLLGIGCWGAQSVYQKFEVRAASGDSAPPERIDPPQSNSRKVH